VPRRKLIEFEVADPQHLNFLTWPEVDITALNENDRETYLKRKQAVES
jgi:hypothetical protein